MIEIVRSIAIEPGLQCGATDRDLGGQGVRESRTGEAWTVDGHVGRRQHGRDLGRLTSADKTPAAFLPAGAAARRSIVSGLGLNVTGTSARPPRAVARWSSRPPGGCHWRAVRDRRPEAREVKRRRATATRPGAVRRELARPTFAHHDEIAHEVVEDGPGPWARSCTSIGNTPAVPPPGTESRIRPGHAARPDSGRERQHPGRPDHGQIGDRSGSRLITEPSRSLRSVRSKLVRL